MDIRFTTPLSLRNNAPVSSPRRLYAAKQVRYGVVEAVEAFEEKQIIAEPPPPIFFDGVEIVGSGTVLDSDTYGDRIILARPDKLTQIVRGAPGVEIPTVELDAFMKDELALAWTETAGRGIGAEQHIAYLIVPIDEYGQAGTPHYYPFRHNTNPAFYPPVLTPNGTPTDLTYISPSFRLVGADPTIEQVEVYRTMERNFAGTPIQADQWVFLDTFGKGIYPSGVLRVHTGFTGTGLGHLIMRGFLRNFVGWDLTFTSGQYAGISYPVTFTEIRTNDLPPPDDLIGTSIQVSNAPWEHTDINFDEFILTPPDDDPDDIWIFDNKRWEYEEDPESETGFGLYYPAGPRFERSALALGDSTELTSPTPDETTSAGIAAETVHNDGGVFIYGDVRVLTKYPDLTLDTRAGVVPNDTHPIVVQYKYRVGRDEIIYGPARVINSAGIVGVAYRGESALIVYSFNLQDQKFYELEEIQPSSNGFYRSAALERLIDDEIGNVVFDASNSGRPGTNAVELSEREVSFFWHENDRALLSEFSKPLEVTVNGFNVPDGQPILAIRSARVTEEEDSGSYNFYVLTGETVYVARRDGDVVTMAVVTSAYGVGLFNDRPIAASGIIGLYIATSKNRLVRLVGRIPTFLDEEQFPLWSVIYTLAYDTISDELYVATDTGIWIHDEEWGGIIGHLPNPFDGLPVPMPPVPPPPPDPPPPDPPPTFAPTMWLVKTDNFGATNDDQFRIFLQGALTYDFRVDWGDGTFDIYTTSGNKTHTYASIGEYIITMTPTGQDNSLLPHLGTGDAHKLLEIQAWGTMEWLTMVSSIDNCINLILTATDIPDTSKCTNFFGAFSGCTSITEIPLMDTSAGLNFSGAWQGCVGLTSFPALNLSAATNVASAWRGCSNLTVFPVLNLSNVITCLDSWNGCSSLTTFPVIAFDSCATFNSAWIDCSGLTSFGLCTFGTAAAFSAAWFGCTLLVAFPAIDFTGALSIGDAWVNCSALADFDAIGIDKSFSLAQCNLDGSALDNVYTNLLTANRTITVTGNPGTGSDNPVIATDKNWTVVGS